MCIKQLQIPDVYKRKKQTNFGIIIFNIACAVQDYLLCIQYWKGKKNFSLQLEQQIKNKLMLTELLNIVQDCH